MSHEQKVEGPPHFVYSRNVEDLLEKRKFPLQQIFCLHPWKYSNPAMLRAVSCLEYTSLGSET